MHTWLPDAHTDAPTAVSVILAGVLLKMGGYGLIRILVGILPEQFHDFDVYLAGLAAVSVIYGAVLTLRQTGPQAPDRLLQRQPHGLRPARRLRRWARSALTGAALQMFTHGTITALLFVMVGLIYDRTHTRQIADLSGLAHIMPIGRDRLRDRRPGLAGSADDVRLRRRAARLPGQRLRASRSPTVLAVFGILLSAGYILWTVQRVFFGPHNARWDHLTDTTDW